MERTSFLGREAVLKRLMRVRAAGKLGQPFLFIGPDGSGKENTALEFARLINCAQPDVCRPGQLCESCIKVLSFQHPDVRWIGPAPAAVKEDDIRELLDKKRDHPFLQSPWATTSAISIGDAENPGPMSIRSIIQFLRKKNFQGLYKVGIVADSHRMNQAAANAFLKTLEEPSADTLIFLLTPGTEGMLPTIISRCQKILFQPWPEDQLIDMLQEIRLVSAEEAVQAARAAGGNARRAMLMLEPESKVLFEWARLLFHWINQGNRAMTSVSADQLHRGLLSHECDTGDLGPKQVEAKDTASKRNRAIQICELLNLHYSDTVACQQFKEQWQPRLAGSVDLVTSVAAFRHTETLLKDMATIDAAGQEIDRNINIGLAMAVLFEGLIDNVRGNQTT